jgi:hypothetical protein
MPGRKHPLSPAPAPHQELLTISEACAFFRCSYRFFADHWRPYLQEVRPPGATKVFFRRKDLERLIDRFTKAKPAA